MEQAHYRCSNTRRSPHHYLVALLGDQLIPYADRDGKFPDCFGKPVVRGPKVARD